MLPWGGAVTFSSARARRERQPDEPLFHVERVRCAPGRTRTTDAILDGSGVCT